MSSRIAHRPRYRTMQQLVQPLRDSQQHLLRTRWTYRRQSPPYEKHALGYRLSLLAPEQRWWHSIILYRS